MNKAPKNIEGNDPVIDVGELGLEQYFSYPSELVDGPKTNYPSELVGVVALLSAENLHLQNLANPQMIEIVDCFYHVCVEEEEAEHPRDTYLFN